MEEKQPFGVTGFLGFLDEPEFLFGEDVAKHILFLSDQFILRERGLQEVVFLNRLSPICSGINQWRK